MTTYVVGDIQGCFPAFERLLEQVEFDPRSDRLWSVGDLVNRGPDNLATLRWFHNHRHCVNVVLGNHDLHMLATRAGAGRLGKSDNFHDILNAPDADLLLDWLQEQPLLKREGHWLHVHAGIPPVWDGDQAVALAAEVSACLRSDAAATFFQAMYGNEPSCWSPHLTGLARLRVITNYLTRMRYCTARGALDLKSKGPEPKAALKDGEPLAPWFQHPNRLSAQERVVFGHWASLNGITNMDQFIALDTGCVWGGQMTLYALETGEYFRCSCAEPH